jgi:hypothetical protein
MCELSFRLWPAPSEGLLPSSGHHHGGLNLSESPVLFTWAHATNLMRASRMGFYL